MDQAGPPLGEKALNDLKKTGTVFDLSFFGRGPGFFTPPCRGAFILG
jgi:hypothetical protein